jgi:amidase
MAPLLNTHRDQLTDYAIYFIEQASQSTPEKYNRSLEVAVETYNQFGPMMDKYDLFICPTLATTQIPAEFTWPSSEVGMNGRIEKMDEEHWSLTYPFNMLSRCPVLSVPSGHAANNVPTGIQLVGKTYDDRAVIEAGKAYEAAYSGLSGDLDQKLW